MMNITMRAKRSTPSRRLAPWLEMLEGRITPSVTIQFDYSYDATDFFTKNPAAKAVLNEAARIVGDQINNHLGAIVPDPLAGRTWQTTFFNPAHPAQLVTVANPTIPA